MHQQHYQQRHFSFVLFSQFLYYVCIAFYPVFCFPFSLWLLILLSNLVDGLTLKKKRYPQIRSAISPCFNFLLG
jgi:hypothetical protein